MRLADCIASGLVRPDVAHKMLEDVSARHSRGEIGYFAWGKNGIGPPLFGSSPPFKGSERWRDSFIGYIDLSKDPESIVVDAIQQAQPI